MEINYDEDLEAGQETRSAMEARITSSIGMAVGGMHRAPNLGPEATFLAGFMTAAQMAFRHPEWLAGLLSFGKTGEVGWGKGWQRAWENSGLTADDIVKISPMKQMTKEDFIEVTRRMIEDLWDHDSR